MCKEKDKIISLTQAQDKGIALSPQLDSNLLTPKHWTGTLPTSLQTNSWTVMPYTTGLYEEMT